MRKLWVVALLFLLWPAKAQATEDIKDWMLNVFGCTVSPCEIHNSKGGLISRFKKAAQQAIEQHLQIRIGGECSSACVIFASKARKDVCLLSDARMGIHRGYTKDVYYPNGEKVIVNETTGENVKIFEDPPKGYTESGIDVPLDFGDDINRWAQELGKMPPHDELYPLTWEEAMIFWDPCE